MVDFSEEIEMNIFLAKFEGKDIIIPSNLKDLSTKQVKEYLPYTNSLDRLVPIWQALNYPTAKDISSSNIEFIYMPYDEYAPNFFSCYFGNEAAEGRSIFIAAAKATIEHIKKKVK